MSTQDSEQKAQNVGTVYERPDTDAGFITDSTEIMQLKAIRKSDIINSRLLGDFDEYGVYSIDKNIVVELVRINKRLTHQNEFGTFAEAVVGDHVFHFRMTPTKKVQNKLVSQLELLEEIYHANGYIIDTRTTLLATYALEPVSNFDELARNMFHISVSDDTDFGDTGDGNGVLKPEEAEYIKHRLAYLQAMDLVSSNLYEKLEEAYFNKRIKILNNVPEAAVVLAEYKKQYSKIEHFFVNNSKHKYRAMNDLLTSIIEGVKGEKLRKNEKYREQMKEANRIYLKTVKQIDESVRRSMEVIDAVAKTMPLEDFKEINAKDFVVALKPEEQKKNETNSVSKKSASKAPKSKGKSSGGGKPKDSSNKSNDKKDNKKNDKKNTRRGDGARNMKIEDIFKTTQETKKIEEDDFVVSLSGEIKNTITADDIIKDVRRLKDEAPQQVDAPKPRSVKTELAGETEKSNEEEVSLGGILGGSM